MDVLSKKLNEKINNPIFLENDYEKEEFLNQNRAGSFSSLIQFNNGNSITLFGLANMNQLPPHFEAIKYTTTLTGARLGFLDAVIELLQSADFVRVNSLSLREVESYLRDDNLTPSIGGSGIQFIPILEECKRALAEKLNIAPRVSGERASPTIAEDYRPTNEQPTFDPEIHGDFSSMDHREKYQIMSNIFEKHIAPSLKRDGGGAHIVFVDDSMVAINYEGTCQSCQYSLTSTMSYIQKVVQLETHNPKFMVMTDS